MDATRTSVWQKILLTLLGAVLVFGLSPLGGGYAFAAEGDNGTPPDVDMSLTMGAQDDEPVEATVTVSVSEYGRIVTGKDGKPVAQVPVTLTGKASYTIDDALRAVHYQCYEGGDAAGYASSVGDWGLGVDKLWGVEKPMCAYQVNYGTVNVMSLEQAVSDGDAIDAYILQNVYPDTENYAVFGSPSYTVEAGEPLDVTLSEWTYDESFKMVKSPLEGAAVHVFGKSADNAPVTDADGKATISFDKAGTYVVTASKTKRIEGGTTTAITAPVCTVTVTAPIKVSVSISKFGDLVIGKDNSPVAQVPVTLTGKASYTIDDALRAVHDQCYEGGAAAGYASAPAEPPYTGITLTKLWGDESGNFGYQLNYGKVNVMSLDQAIGNGDTIDAYILQYVDPVTYEADHYAVFNDPSPYAVVGQPLEVALSEWTYDESFKMVKSPLEGAAVHVFGELYVGAPTTDADGKATITFDEPGTYVLTANKTKVVNEQTVTAITAPVCIVDVSPVADDTTRGKLDLDADLLAAHLATFTVSEDGTDVQANQMWVSEIFKAAISVVIIVAKNVAANDASSERQVSNMEKVLEDAQTALDEVAQPGKLSTAAARDALDLRANEHLDYLARFAMSDDGTDVLTNQMWITPTLYMEYVQASIDAKAVAANEKATAEQVAAARDELAKARKDVDAKAQLGTYDPAEWDISKATIQVAKATYTGKALTPKLTIKIGEKELVEGTDYTAIYVNNVDAGTGLVIVKATGDYAGCNFQTFAINKAANSLKVKAAKKTQTVTAGSSVAASKVFKVTGKKSPAKITYKKASGNAKITISTAGKLTVKKGLKAGNYKVRANATQKATANYKGKAIKNIAFTVKVK